MGKVVHFEIPIDDLERAKSFYGSIFDWNLQTMQMGDGDYTIAMTGPVDETTQQPTEPGSINGGLMHRDASTPAPVITIEVPAIDETLKQIETGGGNVVQARTE